MNKRKTEKAENKNMQEQEDKNSEPEMKDGEYAEAADQVEQLKAEVSSARQEAAETYERLLRLSAEFENYKKRMQRQTEGHRKYANESLIKDLLGVVDNLERALNASQQQSENNEKRDACMIEGLEMTLNEIRKVLKKYHVEPVEALGKPFDPTFHEAVMQQPSEDHPDNTVIQEMQKGYMLHDRLIRPAMVVVSKSPA